ncbi:MAG TPA: alpha/beta hydrolase [Azospirillaceae bacterium]|nr:alpha/beta hydrolase [Azospirillaceae bacterium]
MQGPVSRFYFNDRLRLHYAEWGAEDRPTLLLVHGGQDHCRSWDWVCRALGDRFHILAPDLRGHGDSAWAAGCGYTLAEVVADLVQLLRQRSRGKVHLMGHSYGGAASLLLAGIYPELVERLVVVEGTWQWQRTAALPPLADRVRGWVDRLHGLSARAPRKYATLEDAAERMRAENRSLSAEQAWHLTVHGMHQNEDGTFGWKFDNYVRAPFPLQVTRDDVRDIWSRVACPTLLIRGGDSWLEDPEAAGALALFRDARARTIEGAGHWPHHDRFEEFLGLVRPFLTAEG